MASANFVQNFHHYLYKDLVSQMAGQPTVFHGGVQQDHYKGISRSVAAAVVPFYRESYTPSEFMYGWIPLNTPGVPALYFQFPVLDVKGSSICGAGHFGAIVKGPIEATIISPFIGLGHKWVPMSAAGPDGTVKRGAFKDKIGFTPLIEALNADKQAVKAAAPSTNECRIGNFKVSVNSLGPMGLTQLAPYHGHTIITGQRPPAPNAAIDGPKFRWSEAVEKFALVASFVVRYARPGQEIGQQVVSQSNAAMMEAIYRHIDSAALPAANHGSSAARSVALTPSEAPPLAAGGELPEPSAAEGIVPCPTCDKPIQVGFRFCPHCTQALVWN